MRMLTKVRQIFDMNSKMDRMIIDMADKGELKVSIVILRRKHDGDKKL